ncbi:helix-turn-helix domain-containing protein [Aequorivita echinoideorum]|uniref:AraC family transcriptional regulator n=1 Tax=Aequorivita echinoideorum TaxID=1549647 RepID=A0ABS5S553_9FLAO|nr:AraC family transcriptional regulator [Aequorivita echinoideorum]MBT0608103.1 AraC family transcriptional regulator [Aequorivita echinoideorum]
MTKTLHIKNMVCDRCIKVLKTEIKSHNIKLLDIELGSVQIDINSDNDLQVIQNILNDNGFELIATPYEKIREDVKINLIKLLNKLPLNLEGNLSEYLSSQMNQDYAKISKVFSVTEGLTIEKYFIKMKIEKVKELIQIPTYNFTEISQLLDYSHINHLSRQFKSETGVSLSKYKVAQKNFRNSLDKIS